MIRIALITAAAVLAQPVAAATIVGSDALNEWNLIVLGDLNSSSNVEGRTFVGGNITSNNAADFNKNQPVSTRGQPGLTVVGNVAGNSKQVWRGATVGGNVNNGFNMNGPNQTVLVGGTMPLVNINGNTVVTRINDPLSTSYDASFLPALQQQKAALSGSMLSMSDYLKTQAATTGSAGAVKQGNKGVFTATSSGLNVINIDAAFLGSIGEISFANNGTTIVNVAGTNVAMNDNFLGGGNSNLGESVLWNFYEANTISFSTAFYGSVLAPRANGNIGNFIDGTAVFASLVQNGEIHLNTFQKPLPSAVAVPEPASWAMMIAGFGLVGGAMRRGKRRAQPLAA